MFPIIGLLLASAVSGVAQGDTTGDLKKELDSLRSDYEKRISQLESRIKELEAAPAAAPVEARSVTKNRSNKKSGGTLSRKTGESSGNEAASAATKPEARAVQSERAARKAMDDKFKANTEIRDIALSAATKNLLAERIEDVLEGYIDITGYFRAGYGRSDEGGSQQAFGIPGVAKYRLGNEAENYGELAFAKTFYPAGAFANGVGSNDPAARMHYRMAFVDSYRDYGSAADTGFSSPELWAELANVIPGMPDAKVWAGNRYYRRHDIHINDFYLWDMSGGGGGIEDVTLGNGKLAFAWIGDAAQSSIYGQYDQPDPDNLAGYSKTNFDLRYYDWNFFGGTGELGLVYSSTKSGVDANGNKADGADGFSVDLVRTTQGFLDKNSLHKLSLQCGTGPAKTFTSGYETFTNADGTYIRPDLAGSWRFRATDQVVVKPTEALSIGSALVYQYTDFGDEAPNQQWMSGGVRPIWYITDAFSIALEGGVDWVSNTLDGTGKSGTLGKLTIAPQLALGSEFFSRPVLRAFLTYATWSDGLQGEIGGPNYADRNDGWSWGLQMETWW